MKGKQWLAWTLVFALAGTLALSALAAPVEEARTLVAREAETDPGTVESAPAETGEPTLAGPDDGGVREPDAIDQPAAEEARKDAEKLEKLVKDVAAEPKSLKSVGFDQVEGLMRANNLQVLSFQETVDYLNSVNYTKLSDSLRKQLNKTAEIQFGLIQMASYTHTNVDSYAYGQLDQVYGALRTQFDNIKEGKTQESAAGAVRQLRYYQDQIVMGGENLYITLAGLETTKAGMERQLSALDRTLEEMELRNRLGQISDLQVREIRTGRAKLESGLETMKMNIRTLKYQLENLLGAGLTGTIALGGVPAVTEKEIAAMDADRDLADAKAASYDLYAAAKTLEEAEKTYRDQAKGTGYNESDATYRKALADWRGAQNTYNSALRSYELKFRTLYSQVQDYYQVWKNAQAALEDQRAAYEAAEVKQHQGNLSWNALLSAKDEVSTAEDAVAKARNDLFSSYNTYCWAVEHGILN